MITRTSMFIDNFKISEGNKIIADFVGYEYIPSNAPNREPLVLSSGYVINHGYWRRKVRGLDGLMKSSADGFKLTLHRPKLDFHEDWHFMISVVAYIERMEGYTNSFIISKTHVEMSAVPKDNERDAFNLKLHYTRNKADDRLYTLWCAVVSFCQYYKDRTKTT